MSNDYRLILPLMMATVISTLLAEHLFGESIYTLKLKLKGITLQSGRDQDLMQSLLVGEAMNHTPYVVERSMPLARLEQFFQETHSHSFPVVDEEHNLVGMVSIRDLERAAEAKINDNVVVADIATMGDVLLAYDDEPLSEALQRIAVRDVNKMPVVTRQEPTRVVGVIRRRDIIKAYNIALTRRARGQQKEAQLLLRQIDDTEFLEVEIEPGSPADGRSLAALAADLPHECVIISVRRHQTVLIPHGDTVLRAGDLVSAFLHRRDESRLRDCLLGRPAGINNR
jgi:CIC family chloride channel protein